MPTVPKIQRQFHKWLEKLRLGWDDGEIRVSHAAIRWRKNCERGRKRKIARTRHQLLTASLHLLQRDERHVELLITDHAVFPPELACAVFYAVFRILALRFETKSPPMVPDQRALKKYK